MPFAQQQLLEAIAQIKEGGHAMMSFPAWAVMNQLQTLATRSPHWGIESYDFIERLDNELQRSKRTGHTFTVALIGMDRLPDIMEMHGQMSQTILQVLTSEAARFCVVSIHLVVSVLQNLQSLCRPPGWIKVWWRYVV